MKLDGKTALVLGGIKGIGKAIGLALAQKGVKVALTYHDWQEHLEEMKQDFAQIGREHLILKANLLETGKIFELVKKVGDTFGGLDILVNNIERGGWPVVHGQYTQEQWDLETATTLRAKWWVFDSAIPYLKQSKDGW